jgi:uncharacterized phage-associated protein
MASVFDVAAYILRRTGEITTWKLQKLVYYSQAWSLVWDERPLFTQPIEAWANGPVCPDLYRKHRGYYTVSKIDGGDPNELDDAARETIDAVLSYYGSLSAQYLSDLTHAEEPWKVTRGDLPSRASCSTEITHELMADYYGSLDQD